MKKLLTILFICGCSLLAKSQELKLDNGTVSNWLPASDTTTHEWVYDVQRLVEDTTSTNIVYELRRIDKKTGFLQTQTITYKWVNAEAVKTEFEKALIKFNKDE